MKILCNSSPLIGLARIGRLDMLQQCFEEIVIPRAVWHEVVVEGGDRPAAHAFSRNLIGSGFELYKEEFIAKRRTREANGSLQSADGKTGTGGGKREKRRETGENWR